MNPIRVLLVDDQELVRAGFSMVLDAQEDISVVGHAANGREALEAAASLRPDVVVMDIRMPEMDGVEATRALSLETDPPKVLVLTTYEIDEYIYEALRAGASGFLLKDTNLDDFVEAIRVVAGGEALLAPSVTRRLLSEFAARRRPEEPAAPPQLEELTERETEILRLVARGLSNAEIAAELVVGETTVKTHVSRVLRKLDLRDRVQAVVFAYERGVVAPGSDVPPE